MKFFDLRKNFACLADDLPVYTESDDSSDDSSHACTAAETDHIRFISQFVDDFIHQPAEPCDKHRDSNPLPLSVVLLDAAQFRGGFYKIAL